jgi:hypothetical protein
MPHERTVKKVFGNIPDGKRPAGKPRTRWLYGAENYKKKMGEAGVKWVGTETPGN